MSIKRALLLVGLSILLISCGTGRHPGEVSSDKSETAADLGVRYLMGRGVPVNDTKAFSYFNKAANNDDPFAQNELAYLYATGKGTTQDYTKAFYWYQRAAQNGLASAQYNLGLFYLNGLGTAPNKTLAEQWLQKSAAAGFVPAKSMISNL